MRRYERDHEGKSYSVIAGRLKGESKMTEQAFRYKKDVWTAAQASSHCKDHDGAFEAASGKETYEDIPMVAPNILSQEELRDEIDYVINSINEVGMSEITLETAWEFVGEILRYSGNDIPVDIAEQFASAEPKEEPQPEPLEVWTPADTETIALRIARKVQGKLD